MRELGVLTFQGMEKRKMFKWYGQGREESVPVSRHLAEHILYALAPSQWLSYLYFFRALVLFQPEFNLVTYIYVLVWIWLSIVTVSSYCTQNIFVNIC